MRRDCASQFNANCPYLPPKKKKKEKHFALNMAVILVEDKRVSSRSDRFVFFPTHIDLSISIFMHYFCGLMLICTDVGMSHGGSLLK